MIRGFIWFGTSNRPFYIQSTDTRWLRISSSADNNNLPFGITVHGSLKVDSVKIISSNSTTNNYSILIITLGYVLPANSRILFHVFLQEVMGEETKGKQTSNNNDSRTDTFLTYGNSTYGIKILYPSNNIDCNISPTNTEKNSHS